HFSDQLIEATGSEHNEELYLLYCKGRYQLVTEKVIYSFEDRYDNFVTAFQHIDLNIINKILILGYGLGSIPAIFENIYHQTYNYTAVEIDPEIIRLALKYTIPVLKSPVDLIESDAFTYIKYEDQYYDLICFDLFINDVVPKKFLTDKFIQQIKNRLSKNGVLIINMLYQSQNDYDTTDSFIEIVIKPIFQKTKTVFVRNNLMIFGWNE
nr:fused MFS/spermidine synthase [Saprospiraceae bacterium]